MFQFINFKLVKQKYPRGKNISKGKILEFQVQVKTNNVNSEACYEYKAGNLVRSWSYSVETSLHPDEMARNNINQYEHEFSEKSPNKARKNLQRLCLKGYGDDLIR